MLLIYRNGSLGTKEAISIIGNACERIKSHSGKIYVTFDTHGNDYMDTSEGKNLPVLHCIKGSDGHLLDESVQKALNGKDWVAVEKPTFGSVELPTIIKNNHGDNVEIELIGLCTDICVVSNALILKANFPECKIAVVENCCAGVTPEKHRAAIETMRSCQIVIE